MVLGKLKLGKVVLELDEAIFNRRVHVLLNHSASEFESWAKKLGFEFDPPIDPTHREINFSGFSTCLHETGKPTRWVIVVHDFQWTISDQGTLIHEIVHTIVKIFASNNIPFNEHTQEFLAHDIGNLYEAVAAKLVPPKKRAPHGKSRKTKH